MKKIIFFTIFLHLFTFAKENGETLFTKYGCYGCHGLDAKGNGTYPKLANLPAHYIEKKLKEYREGKVNSSRANIMKPFAKPLSDKEIEEIAKFLHSIKQEDKTDKYYEEFETGSSCGS